MVDNGKISEKPEINDTIADNNQSTVEQSGDNINEDKQKKSFFKTVKKPKLKEVEELTKKNVEINDKYLRLSAEFDNYKKRTLKEKMELIKSGGENVLMGILPVIDDFERAMDSLNKTNDINAVKEGINLIYGKFKEFINQKGIKEIESKNNDFDTDLHEAITKIPVGDESLKGKIVDVIQKGYFLNDKVIRYSKVVIGE